MRIYLSKVSLIGELLTRCLKAVLRRHRVIIGDRVFQAVEAQVQRANDRMVRVRPEKAGRPTPSLRIGFYWEMEATGKFEQRKMTRSDLFYKDFL